ncbi:MAG TPA: hypothetical protein PKY82_33900, partial [Pyrinomonadaceae bacterium]|nr:hypothetical protein [Pyrinomonadaceae bacterium]
FAKVLKEDIPTYLQTLKNIGLQHQAQEKIFPILVEKVKQDEKIDDLITVILESFDSEQEKADYFLKICQKTNEKSLTQMLIDQSLIAKEFRQPFYEILVHLNAYNSSDYEFEEIAGRTFSNEDAEEIYDHEKDFQLEEIDSLKWQRDYLEYLLEIGKNAEAKTLIVQIENDLKGKSSRPVWLCVAHLQIIGGNLQKFIGIEVTDNVTEMKPPNIERLNEAVTMLRKVRREPEAEKLTIDFYARMLALEQHETANFAGLSRQLFKLGKSEDALKILEIMTNFEQEERQAELAQMPIIKDFAPENTVSVEPKNSVSLNESLNVAAELCKEFQQTESAIKFRQKLVEILPNDAENKLKLAELLPKENSIQLLQSIVNERNTPRNLRWQAIVKLREFGEISQIPNQSFDAYSQFYNGVLSNDGNYFLNSLIADKDAESKALHQLIKVYANTDKPLAALKLAEIDKSAKNDELVDLLSKSAEKVGEFQKAIGFERARSKTDEARIKELQSLETEKYKRVTEFTVDAENTRKL